MIGEVLSHLLDADFDESGALFCDVTREIRDALDALFRSSVGPLLAGEYPAWVNSKNIVGAAFVLGDDIGFHFFFSFFLMN